MRNNWEYKLRASPLLIAFALLAVYFYSDLKLALTDFWLMQYSTELKELMLYSPIFWEYQIFTASTFIVPIYAFLKLWKVWDSKYQNKRLGATLWIIVWASIMIVCSYTIGTLARYPYL